ncbi:MAG: PAS domain S-box protein [Candidatus Methanofastidiosia archaeon]|jgi:PAS domain S-box-containing protein
MRENIESATVCTGRCIRVLHVDDEPQFSKVTKHILETEGDFKVDTATCAEEALTKVIDTDYDVIVSDYRLPGKNGLELLKELRASGNVTPFVILAGRDNKETIINALNMGVTQYLNKSSDSEYMYTTLMHTIQNAAKPHILHETAQFFDTLYKRSPVATALYNEKGEIHTANTAYLDMMGVSNIKDIKSNIFDYFKPPGGMVQKLKEGKAVQYETFLEPKTPLYVKVLITPLGVPHEGYITQVEDMTIKKEGETLKELCEKLKQVAEGRSIELVKANHLLRLEIEDRRKTEKALREREAQFRTFFENAVLGVYRTTPDGKILMANQALLTMLGFTSFEKLQKRNLEEEGFSVEYPRGAFRQNLETEGQITGLESTWVKQDGTIIYVRENARAIRDEAGNILYYEGTVEDITESKKVEKKLKLLSNAVEQSTEGIAISDIEGNLLFVNYAFAKMHGYNPKELVGEHLSVFHSPEQMLSVEEALNILYKTGEFNGELMHVKRDGTIFPTFMHNSVLCDGSGNALGMIATVRDITDRKKAEEELLKSKEQYRAIVEDQTELISRFLPDGHITFVNDAYCTYFDKKKEDLIGKNFMQLVSKEHRKKVKTHLDSLTPDNPVGTMEHTVIARGGEIRWQQRTDRVLCDEGNMEFQSVGRDITDRKRAEEKLKESEEKYRTIVELAPDGIATLDLKGVVTSCNTAFLELTGYSKDEIVGKHMTKLPTIHFKDLPQYIKLFSALLRGKIFTPFEFDWVYKDGSIHQGEIHATLMKKNGKKIGIQSIVRDITERKQTENALQQERDKLKALIEGLNRVGVGIDVVDVNYKILVTNDVLKKEFGDLTGKLCYKEYMGLDNPCDFCPMEKAIARNTVEYAEFVDVNGRYKQLFSAPLPNPDHTIDRAIEVAIDITELKEAEKALRESQLKFKRLFMSNPEAAVYLDSELRILDINPQFEELFGYALPEIKGEVITIIVPEDKITEVQTLDKTTERQVYHDTVRKRKDGSLVQVSVSAAPITVEDQPLGHVVLYKDISQLKNVERTLKKTLEKLETVNEKLRVVGSMTRHDIRNKLSTVTGAVYLARKQHTDEKALELFEDIGATCQDMERILDFARTYERLGAEDLYYVNVGDILTEAVTLFSLMDSVTIVNECEGLTVFADSMLRHMFYGLIDNSLRHGETVSTIKVYYIKENDYLKLIYEDDGTGIPDKEKEEIFTEGYGSDTGYGLYIIKKICEVYNWDISETGTHMRGAQFTIVIPQSDCNPYIISE